MTIERTRPSYLASFLGRDRIRQRSQFALGYRIVPAIHGDALAALHKPVRQILDYRERDRDEDESEGRRERHSAYNHGPQNLPRSSAGAAGNCERQAADDEGQRGHDDGPEANPRRIQRRLAYTLATVVVEFR